MTQYLFALLVERIEVEAKQRKSKPKCAYCRKKLQSPVSRYPVCRLSKSVKEQCDSLVSRRVTEKQIKQDAAAVAAASCSTEPKEGRWDCSSDLYAFILIIFNYYTKYIILLYLFCLCINLDIL